MKSLRMFCLVGLAAMAAMAFAGASSASATALCKVEENPCSAKNQVTSLHLVEASGSVLKIESGTTTILCLNVLQQAKVLEPAEAQKVEVTSLIFSGCGTSAAHSNCNVEVQTPPVMHWWLDLLAFPFKPLLLWLTGTSQVSCAGTTECVFDESEVDSIVENAHENESSGHGMINIKKELLLPSKGKLCPKEATVTALLEPLEDAYITE